MDSYKSYVVPFKQLRGHYSSGCDENGEFASVTSQGGIFSLGTTTTLVLVIHSCLTSSCIIDYLEICINSATIPRENNMFFSSKPRGEQYCNLNVLLSFEMIYLGTVWRTLSGQSVRAVMSLHTDLAFPISALGLWPAKGINTTVWRLRAHAS